MVEILPGLESWYTHLKNSNSYTFILQKLKKPPDGLFANIFFASEIILNFSGIFLHRLSRILKFKINWLRVPTTNFSKQKCRTRRENPKSIKPSCKARKKTPKFHTKIYPLSTVQFQRIEYATYSLQYYNLWGKLDFTLMVQQSKFITLTMHTYNQMKT